MKKNLLVLLLIIIFIATPLSVFAQEAAPVPAPQAQAAVAAPTTEMDTVKAVLKGIDPKYEKIKLKPDHPLYFLKRWGQGLGFLVSFGGLKSSFGLKLSQTRLEESLLMVVAGKKVTADKSLKSFIWLASSLQKRNLTKYAQKEVANNLQLGQMLNALTDETKPLLAGSAYTAAYQIFAKYADTTWHGKTAETVKGKVTSKYGFYFSMDVDGQTYLVNGALGATYTPKDANFDSLKEGDTVTVTPRNKIVDVNSTEEIKGDDGKTTQKQIFEISAEKIIIE